MPRVLLAWEGGAGRGHVVTLAAVARALGAPEHIDAALCRMAYAQEIAPHCALAFQGAALPYDPAARQSQGVKTATWAEFLGDLGFRDAQFLIRQIGWWRETIVARRCGLVIGDYAPCALLAAKTLGVKAVGVGTGYGLPPPTLESFPILIPEFSALLYAEAEMTRAINAALAHYGASPLARLAELYAYDDQLVRTLPPLDPYHAQRKAPYLPPIADAPQRAYGDGDEIFAYFSTGELDDPVMVEALTSLGAPLRIFAPGAAAKTIETLAASAGVMIETSAVPAEHIARRSRVMLHSAQHGITCLGFVSGLPQVAAPQHLEHEYHARRAEALGVLRRLPRKNATAAALREIVMEQYESAAARAAAREVAESARPFISVDAGHAIRARLDALMASPAP